MGSSSLAEHHAGHATVVVIRLLFFAMKIIRSVIHDSILMKPAKVHYEAV